jgi:hypothetical protein
MCTFYILHSHCFCLGYNLHCTCSLERCVYITQTSIAYHTEDTFPKYLRKPAVNTNINKQHISYTTLNIRACVQRILYGLCIWYVHGYTSLLLFLVNYTRTRCIFFRKDIVHHYIRINKYVHKQGYV